MQYIQIEIMKSTCSGYATISYHICNATVNRWYMWCRTEWMQMILWLWELYMNCVHLLLLMLLLFSCFYCCYFISLMVLMLISVCREKMFKAFYRHHFHIYCILEYCSDVNYKNLIELRGSFYHSHSVLFVWFACLFLLFICRFLMMIVWA